ncbi:lasso RiPP family leader peptide-containing protein [Streptomyces cinnamoneus]|uniref:lasso RiPP family leader peptide-containing protein n=1 Tax=Streptomyces sp. NPDC053079 TaxID=3365697 RepID=UPI0015A743E6
MADLTVTRSGGPGPDASVYEPPVLVEVGDFSALTLGWPEGNVLEEGGEGLRWWF